MLVNRVSGMDLTWRQEMELLSQRASPTLELTLDDLGLRRHIDQLTFLEMKRKRRKSELQPRGTRFRRKAASERGGAPKGMSAGCGGARESH